MIQLSDEQLHNLGKEALIIIVSSLQDQLHSLQSQLDHANAQLSDTNRQIELLTEQIRIMNQRHFGRKSEANLSEIDGQISLFDSFNEVEYLNQNLRKNRRSKKSSSLPIVVPRRKENEKQILMGFLPVLSNTGSPMKNWLPNFQTVTKSSR